MNSFTNIMARGNTLFAREESSSISPTIMNLIIALLVLIFVALLSIGALYTVRRIRKSRALKHQQLPRYNEATRSNSVRGHRRQLTISTSPYGRGSSIYVYDEKTSMIKSSSSPPLSPNDVPEIRITFPDEHDESGRPRSGRVLVVRVGENGVGLEPLNDEQLPVYQKESGERFHSIDMERIGGLKEKSSWS